MPLIDRKGLKINSASIGAGGVALDQNFTELGDRVGPTNTSAARDPLPTDDSDHGYYVNSKWLNQSTKMVWFCIDATPGAAIWRGSAVGMDGKLLASVIPNPIDIIFAQGTQAELTAAPALASGKPGWTTDTHNLYVGTGSANVQIGGTVWPNNDIDVRWDPNGNGGLGSGDGVRINATGLIRRGDPATPDRPLILQSMGVGSIKIQGSTVAPTVTGTGNIDIQPTKAVVTPAHGVYSGNEGIAIGNRVSTRGGNISIGNDLTDNNTAHTGTINIGFNAISSGIGAVNIGSGSANGQDGVNIGGGQLGIAFGSPSVRVGGGLGTAGVAATVIGGYAGAENVSLSNLPGTAPNNGTLTTPGDQRGSIGPGYIYLYEFSTTANPYVGKFSTITYDGVNTILSGFTPTLPSGAYTVIMGFAAGQTTSGFVAGKGSVALNGNTCVIGLLQQGRVSQGIYMPSPIIRRPKGLASSTARMHTYGGGLAVAQSDRVDFKVNGTGGAANVPALSRFIPILVGVIADDSPTSSQITGQPSYSMGLGTGTAAEHRASAPATQFGLNNAEFSLSLVNSSSATGSLALQGIVTAAAVSSLANVWGRFIWIGLWTEL